MGKKLWRVPALRIVYLEIYDDNSQETFDIVKKFVTRVMRRLREVILEEKRGASHKKRLTSLGYIESGK